MNVPGSREEVEDYASLQQDLQRYEKVCSAIHMHEFHLDRLKKERATIESLLGDRINPETNDHA